MLNTVKIALRINNNAYDKEIESLIGACKKELELSGIASSNINEKDELICQTIITYCKANFGLDNVDSEKLQKSYESAKIFLCMNYNQKIEKDSSDV
jgi:hypothetical protein